MNLNSINETPMRDIPIVKKAPVIKASPYCPATFVDPSSTGKERAKILRKKSPPYVRHIIKLTSRISMQKGRPKLIINRDFNMEYVVSLISLMNHHGLGRYSYDGN